MSTVCIIQARRGSTRLPDKVLLPLDGRPVLSHVIERCQRTRGLDKVVCAVAEADDAGPLVDLARQSGATVFTGSPDDVLDRYDRAAAAVGAETVMRVTSDCPFLSPEIAGRLLSAYRERSVGYASIEGFVHGLGCEIFPAAALRHAAAHISDAAVREHVTLSIRTDPSITKLALIGPSPRLDSGHKPRLVIDYPEDLSVAEAFARHAGGMHKLLTWADISTAINQSGTLLEGNQRVASEWQAQTAQILAKGERLHTKEGACAPKRQNTAVVTW